MLLQGKTAVIFAAGGAIGGAVARAFAREGANLYLSGRNAEPVEAVAAVIVRAGGRAQAHVLDATNEDAVGSYLQEVASRAGAIDVSFNAIGVRADEGMYSSAATDLPLDIFMLPLTAIVGSQFLTARESARHMAGRGRGAIITLSASLTRNPSGHMAGITAACGAVEAMTASLAAEYGPQGVKLVCLRPGGMVETRTIQETLRRGLVRLGVDPQAGEDQLPDTLLLPPTLEETAAMATFLAGDLSAANGAVVDVTGGVAKVEVPAHAYA